MAEEQQKTQVIQFRNTGVTTRLDPKLIPPGGFQYLNNVDSEQEGGITARKGRRLLGSLPASPVAPTPHTVDKLTIMNTEVPGMNTEVPGNPDINPRYIGEQGDIYKTKTYAAGSYTKISNGAVCTTPSLSSLSRFWSMASYNSGSSGAPVAFFGTEHYMLKDQNPSVSAVNSLSLWGIQPAAGVATAVVASSAPAIISGASNSTPILITASYSFPTGTVVSISGVLGNTAANGTFTVTNFSGTQFFLFGTSGNGSYVSGGVAGISGVLISNASNASPIVITAPSSFTTGTVVTISGVLGNAAANGTFTVTNISGTQFSLNGSVGSGAYTSGGTATGPGLGNLNGGALGSPPASIPYDYIYTFRDNSTGNEGNPSKVMAVNSQVPNGAPLAVLNQKITVTVPLINPWLLGPRSIAIYRRGGILTGDPVPIYRFVGYADTSAFPGTATFIDNISDTDLAFQTKQAEFDNDPPVSSGLKTSFTTTINSNIPAGVTGVTFSVPLPSVRPGTSVTFSGGANPETVVIIDDGASVPGTVSTGMSFNCYCQYAHVAGETIEIDVAIGQACTLTLQAFDSLFVAGDTNNPHVLYKSKTGRPESFPVIDALGRSGSINVGSPANPIVDICEFRGNIICLNAQGIYEVPVFNGAMYSPNITPAQRGLLAKKAFCIADGEIWYLAYDGIWSWSGGEAVKRSEAIDQIFHGGGITDNFPQYVYPKIDLSPCSLQWCRIEYNRKQIRIIYPTTTPPIGGSAVPIMAELLYDINFDRWLPSNKSSGNNQQTVIFSEKDTGNLIYMRQDPSGGVVCIDDVMDSSNLYTSDEFTGTFASSDAKSSGTGIQFDALTGWMDLGNAYTPKVFDEVMLDVDPQGLAAGVPISVSVYYDYSVGASDGFVIPGNSTGVISNYGRTWVSLLLNLQSDTNQGSSLSSFGRQASVISFKFTCDGTSRGFRPTFYGIKFKYREVGEITTGPYIDWDSCGHKYDKRFYEFSVLFDTNIYSLGAAATGSDWQLTMDTVTGVKGNIQTLDVMNFTLSTAAVVKLSPTRALATFPIEKKDGTDGITAKLVRVRSLSKVSDPTASSRVYFRIISTDWQFEKYPADIVPFSEWDDGGYSYLKYANQIDFDVDTGGQPIIVQIQSDGSNVTQALTINSANNNRNQNFTLLPSLTGRKWRWYVDVSAAGSNATALAAGGKFQVFSHSFKFQQADRGEVGHSFDWDDLGHPFDKRLQTVTVEWENTGNGDVTMQLDIINGIGGGTLVSNVAQFTITGGRSKRTFPIPADIIAKLIRLYPTGTPAVNFRVWKYTFQKIDMPADTVAFTDWMDVSEPNDKNPSWLWIDADTQNVGAVVQLVDAAGVVMTVTHTGTLTNRKFNYPIPVDVFSKMWRLLVAPGGGGKFQLWNWGFARWQPTPQSSGVDPEDVVLWTPWQDFGKPYGSIARNIILTIDTGGVACSIALQTEEAGTVETFVVTTTYTTRRVVLACNSNLIGKLWRLVLAPGGGGKAKLWDWSLDVIPEPASVNFVDTYETNLGFDGFKYIKDVWLNYQSAQTITFTITSDTGVFSIVLPAHSTRSTEHFNLPAVWGSGLNKSVIYRVTVSSGGNFKLYASSQINWSPWVGENQAGFQHFSLTSEQQLAVA
jgi:hypothetical protein